MCRQRATDPSSTSHTSATGNNAKTIHMSVSDPAVAARLLVRLGDAAELVEGEAVAQAEQELRARILARYRDAGAGD